MAEASIDMITDELKDITISNSKIKSVGKEIGRGAYGRVYTVKYCGWICAAKEIHSILIEDVSQQEQQNVKEAFLRECYNCSFLSHPNIVRFIGVYYPKRHPNIPGMIMELMDENLVAYVQKLPKNALLKKRSILVDVAEGLTYLHSQDLPVIHRDLSPNNILLKYKGKDEVPIAKIADLGVAKLVKADNRSTQRKLTKVPGTVDFMPPEAFANNPVYSTGMDVFSYGGIMLFVATHKWPTPTDQVQLDPETDQLIPLTEVKRRQEYLNEITGDFTQHKSLIVSCLHNNPTKRPTMSDVSKKLKEPSSVVLLQSGHYGLTWEKCADLPSSLYNASIVLHDNKIYAMAGDTPDSKTYEMVFVYDINANQWDTLPPSGQRVGRLQIIDGKVSVIGGEDNITMEATNKVITFNNKRWVYYYPPMQEARFKPGTAIYLENVIVAGGMLKKDIFSDTIEILNWKRSSHWAIVRMKLPKPMWLPQLTISDNLLYVIGYISINGHSRKVYQVPVDVILSGTQTIRGNQSAQWNYLTPTPYGYSGVLPNSCPPVIVGGKRLNDVPVVDISLLDVPNNSWKKIASLTTARSSPSVVPINHNCILVIGGCTSGGSVENACASSITTVEKGIIRPFRA